MKAKKFFASAAALLVFGVPARAARSEVSWGPTDRQITAIVMAGHESEIDEAKLVESKTQDNNVKEFARMMIREHQEGNKATYDLANKLHIKAEKNDISKDMEKKTKDEIAELRKLEGHELDKAYIDHAVTAHQAKLDLIDKTLLPNVSNGELRAHLEKTRPKVASHLEHARRLAAAM